MNKYLDWLMRKWAKIVIFINYSTKNSKEAINIEEFLKNFNGVVVFKAPTSLQPGSEFYKVIPNNIRNCDIFIPIISSKSINSPFTQQEIGIAINANKDIFPIILGSKPKDLGLLSDRHHINYKDKNLKSTLKNKILKLYLKRLTFLIVILLFLVYLYFK